MAAVTMENAYISTNMDMGTKHIESHKEQHKFMQDGEPEIETLTGNKVDDLSTNLAIQNGIKNGYFLPLDEWEKHNAKLRPSRRKKNYAEYIEAASMRLVKAKQRRLDNGKTPKSTREKIARELAAMRHNSIAIDGSLYYLSNTGIYDEMSPEDLKKYRQFEKTSFERFFKSDTFKELNPQLFRAEIHFDELGAMHLQTQEIWLHKDKKGRVSYAKRAEIKEILTKKYGSEEALQDCLDALCKVHEESEKKQKREGSHKGQKRPDEVFFDFVSKQGKASVGKDNKKNKDGSYRRYAYSAAERNTRLEELWRIELIHELQTVALQTAKELGIDYKVDKTYTTDGKHRTGPDYVEHQRNIKREKEIDQQLTEKNKQLVEMNNQIKAAYKAVTGQKAKDKDGKDLSIEKTVEGLKKAVTDLKTEADEQENRKNKAQKEADDLANDNVQAMASLLEKQTQTENENDQLEKLKKLRQQREQEAKDQQQQQQQTFQENEKLLSTQSESLNGLKAQTAEEAKKLQRLKNQQKQLKDREAAKKTDQRELRRKAVEYDKIEHFVGTPPKDKNMMLSEWVKNRFTWLVNQNSLLSAALTTAKKLRIAAAKGLRVLGKLTGKEYNSALTGNTDDQITAKANKAYDDWRNSGGEGKRKKKEDVWDL